MEPALRPFTALVLIPLFLAACAGNTGQGPGAGVQPAAGGLGAGAIEGGLLAATEPAAKAEKSRVQGRLLDGPYVLQLSQDDMARAERSALAAFETTPSGEISIWRNPKNGHWGTLTPTRTYQDPSGRYCREFRQTVTLDGQEHQGNGSACRDRDGAWRIMS